MMAFGILGSFASKLFSPQRQNRSGEVVEEWCKKLNLSKDEVDQAALEFHLSPTKAFEAVLLRHIYSIHLAISTKNSARRLFESGGDKNERRKIFKSTFSIKFIETAIENFNMKFSAIELYNKFLPYMNDMDGDLLAYEKHTAGPFFGVGKRYFIIITGNENPDAGLMFKATSDIVMRMTRLSNFFETLYHGGDRF